MGLSEQSANGISRPGRTTDNSFVESFNETFRSECLNAHCFKSFIEAQEIVETWRAEYDESRPHRAPGEKTPRDFLGIQTAERSPQSSYKKAAPISRIKLAHLMD